MRFTAATLSLALAVAPTVNAFSGGAGGCAPGQAAVGGLHLSAPNPVTGTLESAGISVTFDGDAAATANRSSSPSDALLSELGAFGATRASDVDWGSLRVENAQERWNQLIEELQTNSDEIDESTLSMPLSELAQFLLERKTSAQRAAETVEAVDLPKLG